MIEDDDVEFEGQVFHPSWSYRFIDTDRIEAGQLIFPIEIKGKKGEEFAALHLILNDLEFALNCLREAGKLGIPDEKRTLSKALIFAGLVSYARAFDAGTRGFRTPETFKDTWSDADRELHNYLFYLRQKHIAHSVKSCDAVGVIVTNKEYNRQKGVTGIGVTMLSAIGITKAKLDQGDAHIDAIIRYVRERIAELGDEIHGELRSHLDSGGAWKMAPLVRLPDPKNVTARSLSLPVIAPDRNHSHYAIEKGKWLKPMLTAAAPIPMFHPS
jgi:hypothetical protein